MSLLFNPQSCNQNYQDYIEIWIKKDILTTLPKSRPACLIPALVPTHARAFTCGKKHLKLNYETAPKQVQKLVGHELLTAVIGKAAVEMIASRR